MAMKSSVQCDAMGANGEYRYFSVYYILNI